MIGTSFTVSPGDAFDPYDIGTYYHTRVLAKSILNVEINVEGERLYVSVSGQNVHDLEDVLVEGRESFTIAPANDQYTFTFANKGISDCVVEFTLTEIWTASFSPLIWILGVMGFFLLIPIGSVLFTLNHFMCT